MNEEEELRIRETNIRLVQENKRLKIQNKKSKETRDSLTEEITRLNSTNKKLKNQNDKFNIQKKSMVALIKKVRGTIDEEKKKNLQNMKKLKSEVESQKKENTSLKLRIIEIEKQKQTLRNSKPISGTDYTEEFVNTMKSELNKVKTQNERMKKLMTQFRTRFETQKKEYETLSIKQKKTERENMILKKIKEKQNEFLNKLKKEVKTLKDENSSIKRFHLLELKSVKFSKQKEIDKIKAECERFIERKLKYEEMQRQNEVFEMKDKIIKEYNDMTKLLILERNKRQDGINNGFVEENELVRFLMKLMIYKEKLGKFKL